MEPSEDTAMTILTRPECLERLSQVSLGRIGTNIDALPVILPVHFGLFEESVLFRTIPGTKLDVATIGAVVAFEADGRELPDGAYWSVLLQGIASEVSYQPDDLQAPWARIAPWPSVRRLVRVEATMISGRRFRIADEAHRMELAQPPRENFKCGQPRHAVTSASHGHPSLSSLTFTQPTLETADLVVENIPSNKTTLQ